MSDTDKLHGLRRKHTRERTNTKRFVTEIDSFTDDTSFDDYEHYRDRLQDTLGRLISLDDTIHDLLSGSEYTDDAERCEEYIDSAKRAIRKVSRAIERKFAASTANIGITDSPPLRATAPIPATSSVRLPPIKLEPFSGNVEKWSRFWEQFESSIDNDHTLSTINKHVFLRGYLNDEPKQLVEGIAVVAETYEETKKILKARYGDKNRIIQSHLDYLKDIRPIQHATPEELNTTYIECNRHIHALRSLGEDVNGYGRVLAPKILRAFPDDICQRLIIQVKREGQSEGNVIKLMEFLGEEVGAALTTQKKRGDSISSANFTPTAATLPVHAKPGKLTRNTKEEPGPFCVFCESRGHWAQDCKKTTDVNERIEKLKVTTRCFLCLNRGHSA
jgi:hypothetical protein